jgi:ketosteroid isomerase-like protein
MADIRRLLDELCNAFNQHDLDRIMSLFADDCFLEMPRGNAPWESRFEGKEAVRKALAGRFEGLPDVHYGSAEHYVDESSGAGISRWTLTGTPKNGKRVEVRGCDLHLSRWLGCAKGFLLEDSGIALGTSSDLASLRTLVN